MSADPRNHLEDILTAIEKIEGYVREIDVAGFRSSSLIQDAVIRNIEIVGEAIGRLSPEFIIAHPELPIRDAISMRNFLIHQYDGIDLDVLWETITTSLPLLKAQVAILLAELGEQER